LKNMVDFNYLPKFKSFQFEIVTQIPDWARVYQVPEAEIERQIGIAHVWWQNNPKRGPKKDIMRYLHNWMAIAERKGSLMHLTPQKAKKHLENIVEDMTVEEMKEIRKKNMGGL
jgi:hypothetical protein